MSVGNACLRCGKGFVPSTRFERFCSKACKEAPQVAGLRVNAEALQGLSEGERAFVEAELAALERTVKENPLWALRPHAKQAEFMRPPHPRARCFFGGNRAGKTTAGMGYGLLQCVDRDVVPEHLLPFKRWDPPCYGRVVVPDLTRTIDGVILQKVREWCPGSQLRGGNVDRAFEKVQVLLRFKNGSWIQFMSNDQELNKFGGTALHWVLYDEEPRADIRREGLMRLIDYGGEELFTMTPLEGMSWMYDEFFEPWERGQFEDDDIRVVVVDMDDNPHLSDEGKAIALAGLSGEEREARKSGRFVSFAGLIYPMFSTSRHVLPDEDQLPENVEVFEGLDPGLRVMAAVVFCYLDSEDRLVVFDELALQGQTVAEVAKAIKLVRERWGITPRFTIIDPAARNKSSQTGRSDQQEYMDHGIVTILGQNEVRAGINRVRERLDADKLLVGARCSELRSEFKKYRWSKDSKRTEDDPRDKPVKKDDHLLDALRYVVMQRPLAPKDSLSPQTASFKDRLLRKSLEALSRNSRTYADNGFGPGQWS